MSNQKQPMDMLEYQAKCLRLFEEAACKPNPNKDEFTPTDRDWHSYAEWSEDTESLEWKASTLVTRYHTRDKRDKSDLVVISVESLKQIYARIEEGFPVLEEVKALIKRGV